MGDHFPFIVCHFSFFISMHEIRIQMENEKPNGK